MHSVKKGNQWHCGMKCHNGVDARSGFVHTVEATAANVHDITVAADLLREDDEVVYGDSAYLGIEKREEIKNAPQLSAIEYRSTAGRAACPGSQTMPLTGNGILRSANLLYAARWNTPTAL